MLELRTPDNRSHLTDAARVGEWGGRQCVLGGAGNAAVKASGLTEETGHIN